MGYRDLNHWKTITKGNISLKDTVKCSAWLLKFGTNVIIVEYKIHTYIICL